MTYFNNPLVLGCGYLVTPTSIKHSLKSLILNGVKIKMLGHGTMIATIKGVSSNTV